MGGSRDPAWVGIDLGGTGSRIVLVDETGDAVAGVTVPTRSLARDAIDGLARLVRDLVPAGQVLAGIGVGASGPVDLRTGLIRNPDTLPQFTGLDVAGGLARRLEAPVWIDNDAVVAGLAESVWGVGAQADSVLCVTLGTGVGAALIQDGRPLRGADGQHPEGGHLPVGGLGHPCYCGLPQCWEQVASRTALDELRASGEYEDDALWTEYGARIASGLITLVTLYHPASIAIGGSVAQHWTHLETRLRAEMTQFREFDPSVPMDASVLGEQAGALGATLLPQRRIGWSPGPNPETTNISSNPRPRPAITSPHSP